MKEPTKNTVSRRGFLKAVGAAAAVSAVGAAAVGCSSGSDEEEEETSEDTDGSDETVDLTIGYWGGSPCELPMYIAYEQGFWAEAGINATELLITSDVSTLLANDEIDCFESTPGDFPALYEGMGLTLVDTIHVGCWSGITNNAEITDCASLAGMRVGTTMINGPAYTECMSLCARQGGDPSQIEWITYDGSTIEAALQNGEIDAACASDATTYPIRYNDPDNVNFFYTSADELGDYYCCFLGVNSTRLSEDSSVGDKLAYAMALASDYIQDDPTAAIDESMELGYASSDYPEIQEGLTGNYMFDHGNEDDFRASIKERWQELYDASLLADAPEDPTDDELDEYLESLVDMVAEFHGDYEPAAATADTDGVAVKLEARGAAYII